jgi:hypothetical protein
MVTPSVLKKVQKKRRHPNKMPKTSRLVDAFVKRFKLNRELIYSAVGVLGLYKAIVMPFL